MNFNYEKIKNKILAWPFKEAEKILQKIGNKIPEKEQKNKSYIFVGKRSQTFFSEKNCQSLKICQFYIIHTLARKNKISDVSL